MKLTKQQRKLLFYEFAETILLESRRLAAFASYPKELMDKGVGPILIKEIESIRRMKE